MKQQVYQTNAEYIEAMMKKFKLVDMREQYRDLILEAEASKQAAILQAQLAGGRRRLMNNLADTDRMLEMATGDTRYRGADRRNYFGRT